LDGIPVGRTFRYLYAWIGDESMPPHFKRLLLQSELEVVVTFHDPIRDGLDDRKRLASRLEATMRDGVNSVLHRMCG
jgi:1-acyl-sn-glycerol-3-phosphate acyltransferase